LVHGATQAKGLLMRWFLLLPFVVACNTLPIDLPGDVTVPLPTGCHHIEVVDVMEGINGTVWCKAVCPSASGESTIYVGSCTPNPQWRAVKFVKPQR
jgi:hypothetical protein